MTGEALRAFLADSLLLWRVEATITLADGAVAIASPDAVSIIVRRITDPAIPFRWMIEAAGAAPRPCPSALVMLTALREMLGAEPSGPRLRMATPTQS